MNNQTDFPSFDEELPELNQFILKLVKEYKVEKVRSWGDLDKRVKTFFTSEIMDNIEAKAPGWKKMASYSDGITLTHVTCVFLGMFMLPEFQSLTPEQQQTAKWIVLFHDIEKVHIRGKRDSFHAFQSAVNTAHSLPKIGFPVTDVYQVLIHTWSETTNSAFIMTGDNSEEKIPDNRKLPEIISGIDNMFGELAPAGLIVKIALLHYSINVVNDWPQPAPFTDDEITEYIGHELLPLLKVMMLADNEGWTIFEPIREQQRNETLEVFSEIESQIK